MISNSKFIKCPGVLIIAKSSEKTCLFHNLNSTLTLPYPLTDIRDLILLLPKCKSNISTEANGLTVL